MANTIHHAADDTDIKKVTLGHVVIRQCCGLCSWNFSAKMLWDPNHTLLNGLVFYFDGEGLVGGRIGRGTHGQCFAEAANPNFARSGNSSFLEY